MQRIRGRKNFRFQIRNIHSQRDCSQLTEKYRQYPITSGIFLAGRKVVPSLIIRAVTERGVLVPLVNLFMCYVFSFHLSKIFWTTEEKRTTRKAMGGRVNIEQLCSRSKSLRNQKHFRSRALLVLMAETILGKARHLG